MTNKEIIFRASSVKLREGRDEKSTLSWNATGASRVILELSVNNNISVANTGSYVVSPIVSSTYCIKATFPNGEQQVKHIKIDVFPEAELIYDVKETIDDQNLIAELTWKVYNAKSVKLNNQLVSSSGYTTQLVDRVITNTIQYEDEFGMHTKKIHIANENKSFWLIPNIIKLLLRPFTPIGYVGRKEMAWTNALFLILMLPIISIFIIDNWDFIQSSYDEQLLFTDYRFATTKYLICLLIYVWIMQIAKRLKDTGKSPYRTLFLTPFFIFPLIIEIINSESNLDLCIFYLIFLFIAWLICTLAIRGETKPHKKYEKLKVW